MENVKNISADMVTPLDVIEDLQTKHIEFKALYVVAIDKKGTPIIWASGNLADMAYATLALQAKATDYILERGK